MGQKGFERARQQYHLDGYYRQLIAAYEKAIKLNDADNNKYYKKYNNIDVLL